MIRRRSSHSRRPVPNSGRVRGRCGFITHVDAAPRRILLALATGRVIFGTLQKVIRQAGPQDVRFLRDMLKHAYHWRLNEDPDLPVARYVNNWGRPGDAGLIAWENGPIGAAWYRVFPGSAPGFGFVDEQTPELTIAVVVRVV